MPFEVNLDKLTEVRKELQKETKESSEHEEERTDLLEAAKKVGLKGIEMPVKGPAYQRLENLCEAYCLAVEREKDPVQSLRFQVDKFATEKIEDRKRRVHDKLCSMLFKTGYNETSPKDRELAAKFAAVVGGREKWLKVA